MSTVGEATAQHRGWIKLSSLAHREHFLVRKRAEPQLQQNSTRVYASPTPVSGDKTSTKREARSDQSQPSPGRCGQYRPARIGECTHPAGRTVF